jgi:succinoglycan biosynthesis protein ExoL
LSGRVHARPEILFFAPDVTDVCTIKRADAFLRANFALTVFGFVRGRYNRNYSPPWPHVLLGRTTDGRYIRRALTLLAGLCVLLARCGKARRAAVLYARNIDQLILALTVRALFRRKTPVVYEVLDIQPVFMGRKVLSRMLRTIERMCLRQVTLLVLSSPGFMRNYYGPIQGYRGAWFLLENKLPPGVPARQPPLPVPAAHSNRYRWVVGYAGLIRGETTFNLIARLAKRLEGSVLFKFNGVLTTVARSRFEQTVERHPNIVYEGEYMSPRDLPRVYDGVDFAWAIDLENTEHNSRWLMPCRFYEAGLHGVPCLAVKGFEIGAELDRHGVGWTFSDPMEDSLVRFFETLTREDYERTRARLLAMPVSRFVADDDDRSLGGRLGAIAAAAPA